MNAPNFAQSRAPLPPMALSSIPLLPAAPRVGRAFSAPRSPRQPLSISACDLAFVAMLENYRSSGGLARIEEAERRWHADAQAGRGGLPGLLGAGAVFSFHWHDDSWLPLFQFGADGETVASGLAEVLAELAPVYDGWGLGLWFAQPNQGLQMQCPADLLVTEAGEVLQAARCDRYIAKG
jgi:hypothetical protein